MLNSACIHLKKIMLDGLILFQPSFKREFQSFMFAKTSEDILQVWNTCKQ